MIPTQPFGSTGHQSTRAIFGAAALWHATKPESKAMLRLLLERGMNHIDTAPMYGRSERRLGKWMRKHRDKFFLATKTYDRTYEKARGTIHHSLMRMKTDHVDLIQLHNLVDGEGWETAMSPGGALEAAVEARDQGLARFIGVTGHGVTAAAMHLRSLERFPFDSVLLPYNFPMMQNPQYAADFEALSKVCAERGVAMQTINAITMRPWDERKQTYNTWYEPLSAAGDIATAVRYVLARPGVFLNTASDMTLLPLVLEAAGQPGPAPTDDDMRALAHRREMAPLFT